MLVYYRKFVIDYVKMNKIIKYRLYIHTLGKMNVDNWKRYAFEG